MKNIFQLAHFGELFFAMFYLFTNTIPLHAQWIPTNTGLTKTEVYSLAFFGTNIFAGTTNGGIFRSTNNGASWSEMSTGLPSSLSVYSFASSGSNLFTVTLGGGIFISTNNGLNWSAANNGLPNTGVMPIAVSGMNLFVGTDDGVFRSNDNGATWNSASTGLPSPSYIMSLAIRDTFLFAGSTFGNGVFVSTNNGNSWISAKSGLNAWAIVSFAFIGTKLFAGTDVDGVFLSNNNGANWVETNTGLTNTHINALAVNGTKLFAGTFGGGVFLSTNYGASWDAVSTGLSNTDVMSLAVIGTNLFVGTWGGGVWRRPLSEMTSVEKLLNELPTHFSLDQNYPNPFNPATIISFSLPSKLFVSLKVFDALGREVSTLVSEGLSAGNYSQQWNAVGLPSGIYFYRIQAGSFTETKKLVLLR